MALSPDGKYAATSGYFTLPRLWSVASGSQVRTFREDDLGESSVEVRSLAFSPDGKYLLGGALDRAPCLWEVSTGKLVRRFEGHTGAVNAVAFSPDGRQILTASWDGTARLWDTVSGKALTTFVGHAYRVMWAALSPDGRYVVTGSEDYTARVWEPSSGRELAQLMSFSDGSWAVADRDGRFDASNGGAVDGLHWVVGLEAIALSQLKDRYYEPHLLSKKLGLNDEPLSGVAALASPAMFPSIEVTLPAGERGMLALELTNRGGGIGRVVVSINGKEITSDARPPGADPSGTALQLQVPLDGLPYLIPGGRNRIEIRAYNAEGYLSSRGVSVDHDAPPEASGDAPTLWALVAGVSDYTGDAIDLRYAAKDAADMAQALQLGARRLFGAEHVRLRFLSTAGGAGAEPPTKRALEQAFQELRAASSRDILVVYLSGHGIAHGDDYYFLTQEARSAELGDPAVRARAAISGGEMITWLKQSPALKQVMILDTCAAGAAAGKLVEQRTVTSDQIRAIERLKDRTGFHVLMGSAADRASYEATQYEQGLLTHALLRGMRGAALREGQFVDVSLLFQHAADEVPRLAEHIGGIQRPHIAAPKGTSFDIGQLSAEDRRRVPLTAPKPFLLQPVLQNVDELFDDLGLETRLRAHLREASYASARGTRAALPAVYIDADQLAGAIWPRGQYRVRGGDVTVRMALVRDGKRLAEVRVKASRADLDALTERLADALLQAATNAAR